MQQEIQKYLATVLEGNDLTAEAAERTLHIMLLGGATPAQIAAMLVALRMKGETATEIAAAARVMRHKAIAFNAPADAMDVCGTGGDQSGTLNISTAVAFVLAACDVPVVKHGNRSVSSQSGSSDVLAALGVNLAVPSETMQRLLAQTGLCFLAAPQYHPAMRHVAPIRQELKIRTMFNLLGPLVNPAQVKRQLIGVYSAEKQTVMAEALRELHSESAWVVHSEDGLDELSIAAPTRVVALEQGGLREFTVTPEEAGLTRQPLEKLQGGDAAHNAREMEYLLAGAKNAYRDAVLLNTAAALIIAEKASTLAEGVALAATAIDSGKAREKLDRMLLGTADSVN